MPKKAEVAQNQPVAKKPRKPYPTHEERVAAADQAIARLTALNAAREARIAQAEADLEAAVWLPEVRVPGDGCWKVTLGGSEACAVLLWDPAAGAVLGWLPAAP